MIFISKYKGYKHWITPARYRHDADGNKIFVAGEFVKFKDGQLEVSDERVIKQLKASPMYGVDYESVDDGGSPEVSEEGKRQIQAEKDALETTNTACPTCPFRAKNESGLRLHMRKHE